MELAPPLLANTVLYRQRHKDRRKTEKEVREVAIIGALADVGGGVELIRVTAKNVVYFVSSRGIKPICEHIISYILAIKSYINSVRLLNLNILSFSSY